jgi:hypothetical protein
MNFRLNRLIVSLAFLLTAQVAHAVNDKAHPSDSKTKNDGGMHDQLPAVPASWLPIAYIQSGFITGTEWPWNQKTHEQRRLRAQYLSRRFNAIEVLNGDIDTAAGRRAVRELVQAFREVSADIESPLIGFWSFPRLPGFFRVEDLARQPESYRACSLRADGRLWRRAPPPSEDIESLIKFTGEALDLSNPRAVDEVLANAAGVFRHDGPHDQSVGPLLGFVVLNEAKLSGNYSTTWSGDPRQRDVESPDTRIRLGRKTHQELFLDDDPYYSYFLPPKRAIPLFSENAAQSFADFARERGQTFSVLPADRNEFNDDDGTVALPPWVRFVAPEETAHWQIWEDWVYATWTGFIERLCREICLGQRDNNDFKGVVYFQLPSWYSLRRAPTSPITYQYYNATGKPVSDTVTLAGHPEFQRINPVTMGTDMEKLMGSPWFAGMVHETTKSLPQNLPSNTAIQVGDQLIAAGERHRIHFLAKGALMKEVCRREGKLFGAFARSQHFQNDTPLEPVGFETAFRETVMLLKPDIIATIGPWFLDPAEIAPEHHPVLQGMAGNLDEVWRRMLREYRGFYTPTRGGNR